MRAEATHAPSRSNTDRISCDRRRIARRQQTAGIAAPGSFATGRCTGLEILLDEAFRIPGTGIRFGLDGIIGLVPGLGDVLAGLLSLIIPLAAWIRGVPYVTLVRMAANLGIGVLVGSDSPLRRHLRHRLEGQPPQLPPALPPPGRAAPAHRRDWAFLLLLAAALAIDLRHPHGAGDVVAGLAVSRYMRLWMSAQLRSQRQIQSAIQSKEKSGRSAAW